MQVKMSRGMYPPTTRVPDEKAILFVTDWSAFEWEDGCTEIAETDLRYCVRYHLVDEWELDGGRPVWAFEYLAVKDILGVEV